MKSLTITFALLISLTISTFGQSTSNQLEVQTTIEDGITVVTWETSKEVNTSYFLVEKSINDTSYFRVASLPAAGSSNYNETYSYEDLDVYNQNVSYRITMVCMDGTQYTGLPVATEPMNIAQTDSE
jgi:hypothetical protein